MILITGAGGNIGSTLFDRLVAAGQPVRGAFHTDSKTTAARAAGRDAVTIDMADPATLPAALSDVDTLFLLHPSGQQLVDGERAMITAAGNAGVTRVVKLSVLRADEELTPFARMHRSGEVALLESGLDWTFLRPNFYMQTFSGPWSRSIRTADFFANALMRGPLAFVDTDDVAEVAAHVLTEPGHDGRSYDVTGPAGLTFDQTAQLLTAALGRPISYRGLSDDEARAALLTAGIPPFLADAQVEVSRVYRDGGCAAVTSTVRDITGREPTSFADFVAKHQSVFG